MPAGRILILGITFKQNCPDVRNTHVVDVVAELQGYGSEVGVYGPWADASEVKKECELDITNEIPAPRHYDGIVIAVAHKEFFDCSAEQIHSLGKPYHIIDDIKNVLPAAIVDGRL